MILIHLLVFLTADLISIDPDLIVVLERKIRIITSPGVCRQISTVFIHGIPKHVGIVFTTLDAWSVTEDPLM